MDASNQLGSQSRKDNDADGIKAANRKLKKRELDRKAQRTARERTKNRIRELETLVEQLKKDTGNPQLSNLMSTLEQVTQQRDELQAVVNSIGQSIQRHVRDRAPLTPCPQPPSDPEMNTDMLTGVIADTSNAAGGSGGVGAFWDIESLPTEGSWIQPIQHLGEQQIHTCTPEDMIIPRSEWSCECVQAGSEGPSANTWRDAKAALGKSTALTPAQLAIEDFTCKDTAVRVVLDGWDSVVKEGKMSVSWWKLREVDEVCFSTCHEVERLAILRTMHLLMTYHGDPTQERCAKLPRWLWTRPSQTIPHSYAIDYFVWPGLRERFVFSQHRYCTNRFWHLFRLALKLSWPFELSDCYEVDPDTGRYILTLAFENHLRDINNWRMSTDFFTEFPELSGDIPVIGSIAPSVSWTTDERAKRRLITQHEHAKKLGEYRVWDVDTQSNVGLSQLDSTNNYLGDAYAELGGPQVRPGLVAGTGSYAISSLDSECSWPSV